MNSSMIITVRRKSSRVDSPAAFRWALLGNSGGAADGGAIIM
jgi:hypothetical protein